MIIHKSDFKLNKNIEHVIVGHSHSECAFNDEYIPHFKNLSSSGESYFYTLQKVKQLVSDNEKIKTVFIEFSNDQIDTSEYQYWTFGEMYMSKYYNMYSSFMDFEDKYYLLSTNFDVFLNCHSLSLKNKIDRIVSNKFKYIENIGGYYQLNKVLEDTLSHNILTASSSLNKNRIAYDNVTYLKKIIRFCKEKKLQVYLIRSPLHHKFRGYSFEKDYQYVLLSEFENVEFLDFSKYPLPQSFFSDYKHLNHKGANKFSIWFNELLMEGLLTKTDKQAFIFDHFDS